MVRPSLLDLNPVELKNYPFMVSLEKCSESCNSDHRLSTETCVPSKTKDIMLKYLTWEQIEMKLKHW